MQFREGVDFSFAFDLLKRELYNARQIKEDGDLGSAYAKVAGTLEGVLNFVELLPTDDLKDLPIFTQSVEGKEIDNDIENELIN